MSAEKTSPPDSVITAEPRRAESDSDGPKDVEARATKGDVVFAGGASNQLYEPIPEYEGRHRYDPKAEWTEEEEKALLKRVSHTPGHMGDGNADMSVTA